MPNTNDEKAPHIATYHNESVEHHATNAPVYDDAEQEPEIHWRTYVALASMCLISFVQLTALLGPPTALTAISADLDGTAWQTWIVNVLTLEQAALGPVISSASDLFQARKIILVAGSTIALIGSAIAPGSKDIFRLIAAQVLIGFGIAVAPLSYAVPSEILPRKWRPVAQALMNTTGSMGAVAGPLVIGAFLRISPSAWRNFYWVQAACWGVGTIGLLLGYRPPKRHTQYDGLSFLRKVTALDLLGAAILTAGVTLFIAGLNLGGDLFGWTSAQVLSPLVVGVFALIAFGVYETWGTKTGVLHHDLFTGAEARNFILYCILFFLEGCIFFSTAVWFPVLTNVLFTQDPLLSAAYFMPLIIPSIVVSMIYGIVSTRTKSVRWPLLVGFSLWICGLIGQTTINPGQSAVALGTLTLVGFGLAGPLLLILAGTHLSIPPHVMATGSAAVLCMRSFGATIFTAVYAAVVRRRLADLIPMYVAAAVLALRLPESSLGPFIGALSINDQAALAHIPGVTPQIIGAGAAALQQAFADSIRVVFIIAACFAAVACVLCCCLTSARQYMDYVVDAPVEDLHHKEKDLGSA